MQYKKTNIFSNKIFVTSLVQIISIYICFVFIACGSSHYTLLATEALSIPPSNSKILFVDDSEPQNTYITIISVDGKQKVRLTNSFYNAVFPKYCKQNGLIAFTNQTPEMRSEVYIMNKDGSNLRKILDNACFESFSPDGKYLLYTTSDDKAQLYSYNLKTGNKVLLVSDLKITAADWSKNKEWIVASALAEDGTNDLYLISTMAQGIVRLTNTPKIDESFPTYTFDSKFLAFISNRNGMNEIEYFDIENRKVQRPLILGMYPSISPDKMWVVYERDNDICISRSDGLHTKVITKGRTPHWME